MGDKLKIRLSLVYQDGHIWEQNKGAYKGGQEKGKEDRLPWTSYIANSPQSSTLPYHNILCIE